MGGMFVAGFQGRCLIGSKDVLNRLRHLALSGYSLLMNAAQKKLARWGMGEAFSISYSGNWEKVFLREITDCVGSRDCIERTIAMDHHRPHQKNEYDQISGLFASYQEFSNLIDALNMRGYQEEDISVLMSENTRNQLFAPHEETKAPEGATVGSLSGGILGAIVGGLTLVGNIILPGSGLLVAGPLVGALTIGAVGAAAGGLIGALVGAGIPEHEAKFFEDALKESGQILVVAHIPKEKIKEVKAVFERHHAERLKIHTCSI
jgi:hypothetical protein